jgi:hypothetical protein
MEESHSQRRWAFALLLIIVPAGLFAGFRLSGILQESSEPSLTKTVGKATVVWTMNRPKDYESYPDIANIIVNETIESSYIDSGTTITFSVWAIKYYENDPDFPAWWNDYLKLAVDVAVDTDDGFIHSIVVRFSKTDNQTFLGVWEDPAFYNLVNLKIENIDELSPSETEGSFETKSVSQPSHASFHLASYWVFVDKNEVSHWARIMLEVVYFSKGEYHKVLIPIMLGVKIN